MWNEILVCLCALKLPLMNIYLVLGALLDVNIENPRKTNLFQYFLKTLTQARESILVILKIGVECMDV